MFCPGAQFEACLDEKKCNRENFHILRNIVTMLKKLVYTEIVLWFVMLWFHVIICQAPSLAASDFRVKLCNINKKNRNKKKRLQLCFSKEVIAEKLA